jgi:hypothetical protein
LRYSETFVILPIRPKSNPQAQHPTLSRDIAEITPMTGNVKNSKADHVHQGDKRRQGMEVQLAIEG